MPEDERTFGGFPATALVVDLMRAATEEGRTGYSQTDAPRGWPALRELYDELRAKARIVLLEDPGNAAAQRFFDEWAKLDRSWGDPRDRAWYFSSRERDDRITVLRDWQSESGMTELRKAEIDAPRRFLSDDEAEGV